MANALKEFFQVAAVSCSYTALPPSQKSEMTLCQRSAHVSSGNTDEAHGHFCRTLQLFTVDWIIDRLLLVGCQDFPKDMSNPSSQTLRDFSDFDRHCFPLSTNKNICL